MHRPTRKRVLVTDDEFEQRKLRVVDNADRMTDPYVMESRSSELIPTDPPARNLAVRLDQLRATGSSRVARSIRSDKQPVYKDLFWTDTWDEPRGTYHCLNCGTLATPHQLGQWHNPGLSNRDLAMAMPLTDRTGFRGRNNNARAPPQLIGPLLPENKLELPYRNVDGTWNIAITREPDSHRGPPTFVCSERCWQEQMSHNKWRGAANYAYHKRLRTMKDDGLLNSRSFNDPDTRLPNTEYLRRVGAVIQKTQEDFMGSTTFDQ